MSSRYRYCGLQAFQSDDDKIFFGREAEVSAFLSMILLDKLAVLYGKHGIGKLSFLKAGVLPAFENNFLRSSQEKFKTYTYFIKPHQYKKRSESLSEQVYQHICNAENITELKKIQYSLPENQNILWNHFKEKELGDEHIKNNFVFVFEHVEELFSYPQGQLHWFKSTLNDLLADYAPNAIRSFLENEELNSTNPSVAADFRKLQKPLPVKVIFSISTDEFYLLNRFRDFLPNIFKNVFELKPMTEVQLTDAIAGPAALPKLLKLSDEKTIEFKTEPFNFAPAAIDTIRDFVSYHDSSDFGEESPDMYSLQAICNYCERGLAEERGISTISVADLLSPIMIIEHYYEDVIKRLLLTVEDEQKVTSLLENEMIYKQDKWRLILYEKMIIEKYGISKELLQKLLETRLVSKETYQSGGTSYKISSSIIAEAILNVASKRSQETTVEQIDSDVPQLKQLNTEIEKNPEDYSLYKKRGDHYYFSKKYEEALADYMFALQLNSDDIEVYNYIGIIYLDMLFYDKAIEYFLHASEKDPNYYQPLYNLGITYSQIAKTRHSRNDDETAIEYFKKALEGNSSYVDAYNQIGLIYEYYEEYDKAKTYYLNALAINKDYIGAKINLGNISYKQNDLEQAKKYYEETLSVDPNNALAIYNIGVIFWEKKDMENAEIQIKRACELDPYFTLAYVYLARLYIEQKKYDQALAILNKSLLPSNEIIDLYSEIAAFYDEKEDYDKAAECLNHVIRIDPKNLDASNNLGLLLYHQKKHTEALKIFEDIKKEQPEYYDAYINAGIVYKEFQDTKTAIDNFKQAYQIDPTNILAPYNLAVCYKLEEDYKGALEMYKKVEEITKALPPDDQIEVRDRIGEIYYKLNQPDNAIACLESFIETDVTNASAHRNLALAYDQKGQEEKAFFSFCNFLSYTDWGQIQLDDYRLYSTFYEKIETIKPAFTSQLNSIQLNYLGLAYEYLEKSEQAIKMYSEAIEKDPSDYYPNFNLGNILDSKKEYKQALEFYLKAYETDNTKFHAIFGIANIYYQLNLYDEAEQWYSKASEIEIDNSDVVLSFGNIAYVKGNYAKAYDYYIKSLEKEKSGVALNNLGMVSERLGYIERAIEYNLESIKLSPSFGMPFHNLGLAYTIKKEYGQAFEYIEKGLRKESSSYGFSNLGILYHKLGYKNEALISFEKSIHDDNPEDDAYFNFANYYFDNDDDALAEVQLENTFQVNKYHKPSQVLKAKIYSRKGDFAAALKLLRKAELIDPMDHFVKLELADFFINWKKIEEAEAILNELKTIKFESFNILLSLIPEKYGKLCEAQEDFIGAIKSYQKVISMDQRNEEVIKKIILLHDRVGDKEAVRKMDKHLEEVQNAIKKEVSSWIHYSFFTDLLKESQIISML